MDILSTVSFLVLLLHQDGVNMEKQLYFCHLSALLYFVVYMRLPLSLTLVHFSEPMLKRTLRRRPAVVVVMITG